MIASETAWHVRRDTAARDARRHSRVVGLLRVVLPLSAVAAIIGFTAYARLSRPPDADFSEARLAVTRNAIIMEKPHLGGRDAEGQPFTVIADQARQAWAAPEAVVMSSLVAALQAKGYGSTEVQAADGEFNAKAARLSLADGVKITTKGGYTLALKNVRVDLKNGTMTTREPVSIFYGSSEIRGTSMIASESGSVIVLTDVTTVLTPPRQTHATRTDPIETLIESSGELRP